MPIEHAYVSPVPDDVVPGDKVQPSHWNAPHDLSGLVMADITDRPQPYTSGRLYFPSPYGIQSAIAAPVAFVANTARATPVHFHQPGQFALIAQVTTAVAASSMQAALYAVKADGSPGVRVVDLGSISTAATGTIVGTYTAVPAGSYVLVLYISAAVSLRAITIGQTSLQHNGMGLPETNFTTGVAQTVRFDATITYPGSTSADLTAQAWTAQTAASSFGVLLKAQ